MLAFDLKRSLVKFNLVSRRRDRVAAEVCGRKVATTETEQGRAALLPTGSLPWALKMGLPVYSPLPRRQ